MEMKIDGKRIKELRLKLSWSQERLAEEAGLNPRTVQRAEGDSSASLKTRLLLAEALRVRPDELDASDALVETSTQQSLPPLSPADSGFPSGAPAQSGLLASLKVRLSVISVYYLVVLALVSILYLAFQPAFFSISLTNFSWINHSWGKPWHEVGAWWFMTLSLWALFALPVLLHLYKKHRTLFVPYLLAFCTGLGLAILKAWDPWAVAKVLTALTSVSGMALLLSFYIPRLSTSKMRHGVLLSLSAYVFVWFFQSIGYVGVDMYVGSTEFGRPLPPLTFLFNRVLANFISLQQLIPLMLVLLLSLGRREQGDGENTSLFTRWNKLVRRANPASDEQETGPQRRHASAWTWSSDQQDQQGQSNPIPES